MIHIIMRAPTESPWKSLGILLGQIIGMALILLLGLSTVFWILPLPLSENQQHSLYAVLLYGLLYALILHYRKVLVFSAHYSVKKISFGFLCSIGLVNLCWGISIYVQGLISSLPDLSVAMLCQIALEAILLAIAVSWIEELLFRGLVLGILEKAYPAERAVLWQALIFSGLHQFNTQWPLGLRIGAGIGLFLAGLVLGLARQKSQGLSWSIGLHAGWIFMCQWGVRAWGLALPEVPLKTAIYSTQEVNPVSGIPAIILLTGISYVIMVANRTLKKDVQLKGNTNGSSSPRKISRHH